MRPPRVAAVALLSTAAMTLPGAYPTAARADATAEIVAFGGWGRNVKLSNADAELIVTLDDGPRVTSYRLLDGENVFKVWDDQLGKADEAGWQIRGGHRLWVSPEEPDRTYVPDNHPVEYEQLGPGPIRVGLPPDPEFRLQKEMTMALEPSGSEVTVVHRIRNAADRPTELAAWAISVMAPGGIDVIPLPPKAPHGGSGGPPTTEDFAPLYSVAIWPYLDLTDPRWTLGPRRSPSARTQRPTAPTKLGISSRRGVVGYLKRGTLFVKRFPFLPGRPYPDLSVNFETFTNPEMLELETLGPLVRLGPGEVVEHVERWELIDGVEAEDGPEGAIAAVLPLLSRQ